MIRALIILLLFSTSCSAAVFKDGFEANNLDLWTTATAGTGSTIATSSTQKNSGGYAAKAFTTNDEAYSYLIKDLSAGNYSEIYIRWYAHINTLALASGSNLYILYMYDAASGDMFNIQIDDVDEKLEIYNDVASGSDIDADLYTFDAQVCLEVHVTVHDTTGDIDLWKNGALVANFADVDTKPGVTSYIGGFQIGVTYADDIADDVSYYIDDVVVDTQRIGCKRRSF